MDRTWGLESNGVWFPVFQTPKLSRNIGWWWLLSFLCLLTSTLFLYYCERTSIEEPGWHKQAERQSRAELILGMNWNVRFNSIGYGSLIGQSWYLDKPHPRSSSESWHRGKNQGPTSFFNKEIRKPFNFRFCPNSAKRVVVRNQPEKLHIGRFWELVSPRPLPEFR